MAECTPCIPPVHKRKNYDGEPIVFKGLFIHAELQKVKVAKDLSSSSGNFGIR